MSGLQGRRFLVTRRPEQSGLLVERLRAEGALVVEVPAIAIEPPLDAAPLDAALARLDHYDWIVFTSANAVEAVADRLRALGLDASPVGGRTAVASVGVVTTQAFHQRFPHGRVSLEPEQEFRAEALLQAFRVRGVRGERLLLPTSDKARDTLGGGLRQAGGHVEVVAAYRTVAPPDLAERIAAALAEGIDMALFASPSAVENFAAAAGARAKGLGAAVIGPVTRQAAAARGFSVRVVAEPQTAEGLVQGLLRCYAPPA
jgi:uroporphyrinogen III methyltransferase/synthase